MTLAQQLQRTVRHFQRKLTGVSETVSYASFVSATYTPSSGASTRNEDGYEVKDVVFADYAQEHIDGVHVLRQDRIVTIPALSMPDDVTPSENDRITRENEEIWEVQSVRHDPLGAAWILQVRK